MASTQGEGSGSTGPGQAPQPCDFCPFGAYPKQRIKDYCNLDYEAVKESAERCQACAGIVNFLNAQNLEPIKLTYHQRDEITTTLDLKFASESASHTYEFFVKDEAPAWGDSIAIPLRLGDDEIPRMREPSASTSSTAAFDTLKRWISWCKRGHTQCQPAGDKTLPYRVLEIESTEPLRIRLVENCTRHADYACLSHRWGPQTEPNSLNKDNLDLYKAEVPENKFDPLVKDAIAVTSRLGLRFIWIDCYCIIQDSLEDWKAEAAKMASIYENAFFTISATFSEGGCSMFSTIPRESKAFQITKIRGEPVYIREEFPHPCFVDSKRGGRLCGPLLTRAWVFQERLLSNRFIHFIRGEIFWECREKTWCECNSREFELGWARHWVPRMIRSQDWELITQRYNDTQLTFEKDRLPALAGVAQRYAEPGRSSRYLSGLWEGDLPSALAWYKTAWNEPRPLEKVAPTWSWASLPRGKELRTNPFGEFASLVGYEIKPCGADVYTGAKWTEITVEGPTLDLTVYKESDRFLIGRHEDFFFGIKPDFKTDPDDETKDRAVPDGASCLLLLLSDCGMPRDWCYVFGIVLLPQTSSADGESTKFERIGHIGGVEFENRYLDDDGEYAGYRGGSFPPWADKHRHTLNHPKNWWLLERVKRRHVTLV